jgi:hypothetical protein
VNWGFRSVVPAQAGIEIPCFAHSNAIIWVPACAGIDERKPLSSPAAILERFSDYADLSEVAASRLPMSGSDAHVLSVVAASQLLRTQAVTILGVCGLAMMATGCQTSVGGQTLPSGYYLRDDVQYFPAGPEFLLTNTKQAIEQYKLDQTGFQSDFGAGDSGPGVGGGFD